MSTTIAYIDVETLALSLSQAERFRLADRLLNSNAFELTQDRPPPTTWNDIRGLAPDLLHGEDAQEWVTRTRREADESRAKARGMDG